MHILQEGFHLPNRMTNIEIALFKAAGIVQRELCN